MTLAPKKPVASLLFNILITRYLTPETHLDLLMRTGHYAEPEPAHNLAGDWSETVMPAPEHFDLDREEERLHALRAAGLPAGASSAAA